VSAREAGLDDATAQQVGGFGGRSRVTVKFCCELGIGKVECEVARVPCLADECCENKTVVSSVGQRANKTRALAIRTNTDTDSNPRPPCRGRNLFFHL